MLLNLLDNAIKYGPSGQRVVVNLAEEPGRVLISVDDEGPGVPRDERERIWGGYYRLGRERKSAIAGTGIGLAVVRELASRHGGRTWVEQRNDGGARFIIELPTSARTKTSPEKRHPSPRQVAGEKG
jgi:signal transduction histidine kinase